MSEKIYEYRDEQNYFVAKVAGTELVMFGFDYQDTRLLSLENSLASLLTTTNKNEPVGFQIHLIKYASAFQLVRFVLDMFNEVLSCHFKMQKRGAAILITEVDQLRCVHLPDEGVALSSFFNQQERLGDTILIATRNEGKTKEFRDFFSKLGYGVENLNNYPDLPEVAETGTTFEENARLKAETIAQLTGKMVLADDSGLKVDALGGLPGVWSARFSEPEATDEANNQKLLHELAMVFNLKDRSAQFHATLVLAQPDKESLVVEADWPGYIGFEAKGENGFGYDPLFLVGETGKTSAELTLDEKNTQSHRARALEKLLEVFPKW